MARLPREPASPSPLVPALLRYLAARGRDAAEVAARFELPADAAERDEVDVAPVVIDEMIEAAAGLLAEPYLALRLPAELPLRRYGLGELAARASSTLRDALGQVARHAALVHPLIVLALEAGEPGEPARWRQSTPSRPRGLGRHTHDYALAHVLTAARGWLGAALPVSRVWFAHPRPRDLAPLERWFGTEELVFGEPDSGFAFARALLDRPLVTADPRLLATVSELVGAEPAAAGEGARVQPRVAAAIRAALPDTRSAADIADAIHMSPRTLQRRLEAEGTSFTAVVDDTRETRARELLADPALPLAEIAYQLGFADLATFSRAFKRWTGTSPGRFRSS